MSQDGKKEELEYIQLSHRPRTNRNSAQGTHVQGHKTASAHHESSYQGPRNQRMPSEHEGYEKERPHRSPSGGRKRDSRRKVHMTIIVLLVILAVVLAGVIGWKFMHRNDSPVSGTAPETSNSETLQKLTDADFQYSVSADRQEIGEAQELKEIADYEGYALRYPVIGNDTIDAAIKERAEDIVSVFKSEVQAQRTDTPKRMTMVADYEIYQTGNSVVSVKFDIQKQLPSDNQSSRVETYTYRLTDGAQLALSDVLKDGYLELLSEKTKAFAETQEGTVQEAATAAAEVNFQYYTWNEDGLTLYFAGGSLIPEKTDTISFTIPMTDLSDYLTVDLAGDGQAASGQPAASGSSKVDPAKPMICLTFDDGPKSSTTPELLDILEENDARATFFVVGDSLKAADAKEIVGRELALGCQVGNHTMNHENLKNITDEEITQQIEGVNDILTGWGYPKASTVRPPYGGWNNHVLAYVNEYPLARWDVDTLDWQTKSAEATINAVLYDEKTKAADGDIILMHDIHEWTIEACKTIIPELKAQGFQLVTMEEMYAAKGIPFVGGQVYYSADIIKTDFGS